MNTSFPTRRASELAAMTNVGMHVIGEVQRGGAARQVDDRPARGQHVDAVLDQFGVEAAGEFARALRACLQQPPHPSDLAVERGVAGSRALRSKIGRAWCRERVGQYV